MMFVIHLDWFCYGNGSFVLILTLSWTPFFEEHLLTFHTMF